MADFAVHVEVAVCLPKLCSDGVDAAGDAQRPPAGLPPLLQILPRHARRVECHGHRGAEQPHACRVRQLDGELFLPVAMSWRRVQADAI